MKIKQLTKRYTIILAAAAVSACLSGCTQTSSEEKELAAFSAEISDFSDYIVEADEEITS